MKVWTVSHHLVGQAVGDDPIDDRHRDILPDRVWGQGDPEWVRRRVAEEMKATAGAARRLGVDTVVGFTGSWIWKHVAMFPPRCPAR